MTEKSNKLWQGRASGAVEEIMIQMGESISLDIELYREDLYGSAHHAQMLARCGIITSDELEKIITGLRKIKTEIEAGELEIRFELEDIHTHIENRLIELCGEAGKKLHTARSRNDQVALDTHLYVRRVTHELAQILIELCRQLLAQARANLDTIVPAYTHLQVAQPIRLSHHLLAHFWSFARDVRRMEQAHNAALQLPLGSGALAGVNYATDREFMRKAMDFDTVAPNSMDGVASRDHILNFLYATATFMAHASRFSDEIILWNTTEFGFLDLPDSLTTGSSIMPQKKNPDLAELIRGKSGRVISNLNNLFINLKGLPYVYNRDLQEDRFPLLDSYRQTLLSARALTAMVSAMKFKAERMSRSLAEGFATATDLADALVQKRGVAFRDAHHLVGALVARCVELGQTLASIAESERTGISEHFGDEEFYRTAIDIKLSADKKISVGGTAHKQQQEQLQTADAEMTALQNLKWRNINYNF